MRQAVAGGSWRLALVGLVTTALGAAAIVAASLQGMALVPGGSILDGYEVGLLPWMDVGTWLVPLGAVFAAIGGLAAIWIGRAHLLARIATIPVVLTVLFWLLLVGIHTAPRPGVGGTISSSNLATFVYSAPANTILFLLIPAAAVLLIAGVSRRRRA